MKKLVLLIALLMSCFLFALPLFGADVSLEKAVQIANQEIGWEHFEIDKVNKQIWNDYKVLVYGGPETVSVKDQDVVYGQCRYLGFTPTGDLMTNPEFPPDHNATTTINNWSWEKGPWAYGNNDLCKPSSNWDNQKENEAYIKAALDEKYGGLFQYSTLPKNADNWYEVTKILQPRTSVTPGLGRMWHLWNGSYWYITVVLPTELPKRVDIAVINISNTNPVKPNSNQTASVTFRNNGNIEGTFEAQYFVNDSQVGNEAITLKPGESINKSFNWNAPGEAQQVTLKAYAVPLPEETKIDNNQRTCSVDVININTSTASAKLGCLEQPSITQTWEELYTWEVYHPDTCYDEEGKEYDCSWTESKWSMPTYSETLSASISVNTKQGIPTDPDNPKESDRESRGSWEIIPDTQQRTPKYSGRQGTPYKDISIYGWDPNEVTRAGYGFEVTVKTQYTNDWETKVPDGASAHGGKYQGPTKVTAYFYNTAGRFVESVPMVATKGKPEDKNITWELPEKRLDFHDGTRVWERKHYTDINNKDGYYEVVVYIEEVGKHDLCLIRPKEVAIYGDMYDDSSTRIARRDE